MPVKNQFGSADLERALKRLGFSPSRSVGSSHQKWKCQKQPTGGQRPFIIVIQGKKTYVPQTCNGYMREIFCFGFSKDEIAKAFK